MIKIVLILTLSAVISSAWFVVPTFGYNSSDSTNIDENFVRDDKQEVVIDKKNAKMYYDSTPCRKMHFIRAWSYCRKLNYLDKTDWRVPTKDEARDLLELSRPNIKSKHAFKNAQRDIYWTSTEFRSDSGWYVDFDLGRYSTHNFEKLHRVICVRDILKD
ncbi:DUF1566 domain-containing protein [Sulfurimonas sp.]|uniref:Lcl C-terminal domain-containing protein n=1 Tax=Sulfurimonas sp. TaxID=2022749 RepID=UPI00356B1A40